MPCPFRYPISSGRNYATSILLPDFFGMQLCYVHSSTRFLRGATMPCLGLPRKEVPIFRNGDDSGRGNVKREECGDSEGNDNRRTEISRMTDQTTGGTAGS
ncbi:hypothetical protein ANN_14627 [Periplaneta americana]|uniref:Uncharacterized protein n=1 Tax=Periplaneta americana TaxID=6978 RepID=A0ABQ8SYA1_PERAM|nr:hypothetical protein ANN_14627 [Periplaneta americana]